MPTNVVKNKKEERYWDEAKKIVQKQTSKKKKDLKDQDWGLINKIFQAKKEKNLRKKRKKADAEIPLTKTAVSILVEPYEPLVMKAIALIESKNPSYFTNAGVKQVVVETESSNHLGKVQSDQPDTIFVSVNKIKSLVGTGQADEEAVVRQIALTLAHETGHLNAKFQGGEQPAITEEQNMSTKLSKSQQARLLVIAAEEIGQMEKNLERLKRLIIDGRSKKNKLLMDLEILRLHKENREIGGGEGRPPKTNFPKLSPAQVESELKRLSTALADTEAKFAAKAEEYKALTGNEFHGPDAAVPAPIDLGAVKQELAGPLETPAPVTIEEALQQDVPVKNEKPAKVPLPPGSDVAEEGDISDAEAENINMLWNVLTKMVLQRVVKGTIETGNKKDDLKNSSMLPDELLGVTTRIIEYVLGISKDTNFLAPNQQYKGLIGDKGSEAILQEIERKRPLFETYKDAIIERHEALAAEKDDRPNYRFLKKEIARLNGEVKKLEADRIMDPNTGASKPKNQAEIDRKRALIAQFEEETRVERQLRANLSVDREHLAEQMAKTINGILRAPRAQGLTTEQYWDEDLKKFRLRRPSRSHAGEARFNITDLPKTTTERSGQGSPGWDRASEEERKKILEIVDSEELADKRKGRLPMHKQVPAPQFGGTSSDATRGGSPGGKQTAKNPEPLKNENDPPTKTYYPPHVQPGGSKPTIVRRPKKADAEIPLQKSSAKKPFDPSDPRQEGRYEKEMLGKAKQPGDYVASMLAKLDPKEQALIRAVLRKVKEEKIPVMALNGAERATLSRAIRLLEQEKLSSGFSSGGDRPVNAPSDVEKAKQHDVAKGLYKKDESDRAESWEATRKQHEHGLFDALNKNEFGGELPHPDIVAQKAERIAQIEAILAKWKRNLKQIKAAIPTGLSREQRAAAIANANQALRNLWIKDFDLLRGTENQAWLPPQLSTDGTLRDMMAELNRHLRDLKGTFDLESEFTTRRRMGLPTKRLVPTTRKMVPWDFQSPNTGKPPAATDDLAAPDSVRPIGDTADDLKNRGRLK